MDNKLKLDDFKVQSFITSDRESRVIGASLNCGITVPPGCPGGTDFPFCPGGGDQTLPAAGCGDSGVGCRY